MITSRRQRAVQVLMGLALVATLLPVGTASPPTAQAEAATVSSDHPFSDPVWYPLRQSQVSAWVNKPSTGSWSALVSCVKTNCSHKSNSPHGYWAIDFIADRGDAVYAAGSGVMHVGEINEACTSSPTSGTWVWIDHGGGVVSRYHHLGRIVATEGQLVTPATKIAEVGDTGNPCGSSVDYLHFEVRRGGVRGDRYNPNQLRACLGASLVTFPAYIGHQSWDTIPHRTKGLPATNSSCIPSSLPKTPNRTGATSAVYGNERVALSWPGPSTAIDRVTVSIRIYHPSLGRFSGPEFVQLPGTARSHTFKNLINGRPYMFRVSFHNAVGNSAWAPERIVVPAAPPTQPTMRRLVATRTRIGYGWYQSQSNGSAVTGYVVAIRRQTSTGGWTRWYSSNVPASSGTTYNWFDETPNRAYEVRVHATSAAGPSAWSPTSSISTAP